MSIPSTLANVLIEGNTIESGGAFTYKYMLTSLADCRVIGNYFSGIENNATTSIMLSLNNSTNTIQGNTFVRGSSSINAYITNVGSSDQIIVHNIFDLTTTDGSNENLGTGLTTTSIFEKNKNQIRYSVVPVASNESAAFGITYSSTSHSVINFLPDYTFEIRAGAIQDKNVIQLWDQQTNTPTSRYFSKAINLNGIIPSGARILDIKTSIYNESPATLDTAGGINVFTISMQSSNNHTLAIDAKTYPSDNMSNWQLNYGATYSLAINSGNEASLRSAYQVLELNTNSFTTDSSHSVISGASLVNQDISSNFITGIDNSLTVSLQFSFLRTASVFDLIIVLSPIIVKYVW